MLVGSNSSIYDLDLYELESITDPDRLVQIFKSLVIGDSDFKTIASLQWMDNFMRFGGIRNFPGGGPWNTIVNRSIAPISSPRSITPNNSRNVPKLFKACQVRAANITRNRPSIKVYPSDENEEANKAAQLENLLIDYFWSVDMEDDINYEAVLLALLTPLVARKDYLCFDFNKARMTPKFNYTIDPMTGMEVPVPMLNERGKPLMQQMPWNKSELVSAFRLIFNPSASWMKSVDYVGDVNIYRFQTIVQNYNRKAEGYYPENLDKITKGIWFNTPAMMLEQTIKQLNFGQMRWFKNFSYSQALMKDGVVGLNFFIMPSPTYPFGREIFIANGQTLYDGPSRAYRENPTTWHPYSFLCYERVPTRLWGTSFAEKLTDIEAAYNSRRTDIDQAVRTYSQPKMLLPNGAQIEPDATTGGYEIWRYNPWAADGGKPGYIQPPPYNTMMLDDLKMLSSEFVESSGVTEIMQGIRPQGVSTYRGLEVLREESNNVDSPMIRMYEMFIQTSQENKIENIRTSLVEPDRSLMTAIKMFKKINKYTLDIDIKEFLGKDLSGKVVVEPMSSIAKSKIALQEKYMQMAQLGALGDIVNDPDLNEEFKKKMDVFGFERPENKQVTFARYENRLMLQSNQQSGLIVPPVEPWHDDPLHIREVEQMLLDPVIANNPIIKQAFLQHRDMHIQQQGMKMMQAAQSQAVMMTQNITGEPTKDLQENGNNSRMPKDDGMMFGPENGGTVSGSMPDGAI
jgi:hypothetical protein